MVGVGNKKLTIVLIVLVLVMGSLSGCLGSEKTSDPEAEFWEHIDAISNLAKEAGDIWDLAKKEENNTRATSLLKQMKSVHETALYHANKAIELAPDENSTNYAYYLSQSLEYSILADEKLIELSQLLEREDFERAKKIDEELYPLTEKSLEMLDKAEEYKPTRGLTR